MRRVEACSLPSGAFLERYRQDGNYVDCFRTRIANGVTQAEFVSTFYTTWLFKLERLILRWAVNRPSSDQEALQLALGRRNQFAAWQVEARDDVQLLMCDISRRTRSWLMAVPEPGAEPVATLLYFGSAVVARQDPGTGRRSMGIMFRVLLGFHKVYSRLLLHAAQRRLSRR